MPKYDFNNFIEITLRHGCSPVNLLHIFRSPFPKNTSGRRMLLVETSFKVLITSSDENININNECLASNCECSVSARRIIAFVI